MTGVPYEAQYCASSVRCHDRISSGPAGADLRYGESEAVVATGAGSNILHFARAMGSDPIIAIDVKDGR